MKNGHHILPVLKEGTSLTFERSIKCDMSQLLDTEVSAIQRCPLFRCPLFRDVRFSYKVLH